MRLVHAARALAAVTVIAAAFPAAAVNCYVIVDRSNEVVYQDITSPIDLSDEGTAARAPASDTGGINLPRITVPRDTGGGMSVGGPPSGMSIR